MVDCVAANTNNARWRSNILTVLLVKKEIIKNVNLRIIRKIRKSVYHP